MAAIAALETTKTDLRTKLRQLQPLASRKPAEELQYAMKQRRHQAGRTRLEAVLTHPDVRATDIAQSLAEVGKVSAVFETKVSPLSSLARPLPPHAAHSQSPTPNRSATPTRAAPREEPPSAVPTTARSLQPPPALALARRSSGPRR